MLQKLREHTSGWIAKIILAMLVFVFSFFGIESYFMSRSDANTVATVGDQQVTQQDFQNRINDLRRQAQNPQSGITQDMFDRPDFRHNVLEGLINQKLLEQANDDMGITVTNGMVRQEIASYPAFQIKGQFDPAAYKAMLGQQGMTPVGFEQKVRHDLSLRVLTDAVTSSALATDADIDAYLRLNDQTRDIRYVALPTPEVDPASITDKAISDYYQAHKDAYMTPETVTIRYVEVKASDMKTDVTPGEQALKERYEKEKSRFVVPEQREVSHILVSVPANASPAEQKKALSRAKAIEKKLHDGADFAELARKVSDDLGSKRQGGDLGWIEPGMTDKAFDEKAFQLPQGTISAPVLSPEGYHIILVKDIKPGHTKPLAEVKDQLAEELLGSERERKYNDVAGKLVDLVYQDPNSLEPVAKDLGLKIKTAGPFTRKGGTGIASHPEVVQAAFSTQVLDKGMTSDPVKLGSNEMVALRVDKHATAEPRPLSAVKDQVRQALVKQAIEQQSRKQAEAMLAKLQKGERLDALADSHSIKVTSKDGVQRFDSALPPAVLQKVFKMPHPGPDHGSFALVNTGIGQYDLVEVSAVHPGDPSKTPAQQRKALLGQMQQLHGNAEVQAMLKVMRAGTKVDVQADKIEPQPQT